MKKSNKKIKVLKKTDVKKKVVKHLGKEVSTKSTKQKNKMVINKVDKKKKDVPLVQEKNIKKPILKIIVEESSVESEQKKKSAEKMYFTKDTEMYIIKYNKEDNQDIRNHLYETYIKNAFDKLVENVFNTFKFTYFDNSPIEIQKETVAHLVSNMNKFEEVVY